MTPDEIKAQQMATRRKRVLRVMWDEMNGWMHGFAMATHAVAKALVGGTLTEEIVTSYPLGDYPENLSRAIAHQAGLTFHDDGPAWNDSGWRVDVDAEDIHTAIQALRAIPAADVALNTDPTGCTWQLYPENLDEKHVDIDQIRELWRGLSLTEAAQLLIDVNQARP